MLNSILQEANSKFTHKENTQIGFPSQINELKTYKPALPDLTCTKILTDWNLANPNNKATFFTNYNDSNGRTGTGGGTSLVLSSIKNNLKSTDSNVTWVTYRWSQTFVLKGY